VEDVKSLGKYWLPLVGFALLIIIASSIPGDKLQVSQELNDKIIHGVIFGILNLLLLRALVLGKGWSMLKGVLLGTLFTGLFGVLDEVHQSFTPNRMPSEYDVLADVIGACISALIFTGVLTFIRSRHKSS